MHTHIRRVLRSATFLTFALDAVLWQLAPPHTLRCAMDPSAVMLAYRRPATLLALALLSVVGADAGAPAYLALGSFGGYVRIPAVTLI